LDDEKALTDLIAESQVFVCENENEILGMIYFVPNGHSNAMYEKQWSIIRYLGVHPDHRGKGIGRILTEMCVNTARESKEKFVVLHTSEFMYSARKMYEEIGFEKKEQFVHYGKKYWTYLLQL